MGRSKLLLMLLLANLLTVLFLTNGAFGEELVRGVVVSPARVVATVAQGDQLPPIRVLNGGEEPLEISVYVGRGEHRWDGSPVYLDSPAERLWGASCLKLDKDRFILGPGEEDTVLAVVGDLNGIEGGFYPVIFFEVKSPNQFQGTTTISRLAVITLLQLVDSPPADLVVTGLDIQQTEPGGRVGLFPIVSNLGKVHGSFSGYIEVAEENGTVMTRLPVQPVTVLPGCSRRVPLWWQPEELPIGTYQVSAHLAVDGQPIRAGQWAFRVVEPYQLATIRGDLVSWQPEQVTAYQPAGFTAIVHNSGTQAWRATGELMILDAAGDACASVAVESDMVPPGGSCQVAGLLPPLHPGRYTMRMSLVSDGVALLDAERTLEVLAGDAVASR